MNKIWINKPLSLKDAGRFDAQYYLKMSGGKRLDIMQYLRELYYKIKEKDNADRKRLRRVIKIIR